MLKTSLEAFLVEVEVCFRYPADHSGRHPHRRGVSFPYPLDPMDRIIAATALDRGVPLVTKDKMIRKAKALSVIC